MAENRTKTKAVGCSTKHNVVMSRRTNHAHDTATVSLYHQHTITLCYVSDHEYCGQKKTRKTTARPGLSAYTRRCLHKGERGVRYNKHLPVTSRHVLRWKRKSPRQNSTPCGTPGQSVHRHPTTCRSVTMGECLPGARPARYFSINYPNFSPRFTLPWRSPPSRPHCTAHLPYKARCKIKQYL